MWVLYMSIEYERVPTWLNSQLMIEQRPSQPCVASFAIRKYWSTYVVWLVLLACSNNLARIHRPMCCWVCEQVEV